MTSCPGLKLSALLRLIEGSGVGFGTSLALFRFIVGLGVGFGTSLALFRLTVGLGVGFGTSLALLRFIVGLGVGISTPLVQCARTVNSTFQVTTAMTHQVITAQDTSIADGY